LGRLKFALLGILTLILSACTGNGNLPNLNPLSGGQGPAVAQPATDQLFKQAEVIITKPKTEIEGINQIPPAAVNDDQVKALIASNEQIKQQLAQATAQVEKTLNEAKAASKQDYDQAVTKLNAAVASYERTEAQAILRGAELTTRVATLEKGQAETKATVTALQAATPVSQPTAQPQATPAPQPTANIQAIVDATVTARELVRAQQAEANAKATAQAAIQMAAQAQPQAVAKGSVEESVQGGVQAGVSGQVVPTATVVASASPAAGTSSTPCNTVPTDLEAVPRSTIKAAPLGQWIHPVFKSTLYQSSGGKDGQWSWAHTVCLITAQGGSFLHFEGNDGSFNFRHNAASANVEFAILTTSKWKPQFMEGAGNSFSLNVRAMPGTTITITREGGQVLGTQAVSQAGDLTIIMPDDGVTGVRLSENDPAKTFEVKAWVGPYDRGPGVNAEAINVFDARQNRGTTK
jgi:hypothetical protein